MARVMGCCLMAPRHHLKHCWQEHVSIDSPFKFMNVSVGEVKSLLRNIDSSKETGNEFAQSISSLMNMSVSLSCIPHELKKSETSLLYTGQNNLEPQNYRPLGVLTCLSKILNGSIMIKWVCILKMYCLRYYLHFVNDTDATMCWQNWWKTANKYMMKVKMLDLFC